MAINHSPISVLTGYCSLIFKALIKELLHFSRFSWTLSNLTKSVTFWIIFCKNTIWFSLCVKEQCPDISCPPFPCVVLRAADAGAHSRVSTGKAGRACGQLFVSLCKSPIKAHWFVWPCSNQRQGASVSVTLSRSLPFKWGLICNPGCGNGNEESIGDYEA